MATQHHTQECDKAQAEQAFGAAFTREMLRDRERRQHGYDVIRRSAFAVLTRDHAQLEEAVRDDQACCEAFLKLVNDIRELQAMRKAEDELIDKAWLRLVFVLDAEANRILSAADTA